MIADDCWWLLNDGSNLHTMGASSIHYNHIARTDFTSVTVPAAHEPVTRSTTPTTLTVVWSRPRSSCDPVAHHIATEPRLRPSFSVHRALTAASSFVLPPSRWPSGRPPRPRPHRRSSSAVQPRDVSPILTLLSDVLLNNNIYLHSVGTNIPYPRNTSLCEAQHWTA